MTGERDRCQSSDKTQAAMESSGLSMDVVLSRTANESRVFIKHL